MRRSIADGMRRSAVQQLSLNRQAVEEIRQMEGRFQSAKRERDRKKIARQYLEHWCRVQKLAGLSNHIPNFLLGTKAASYRKRPPHGKREQRIKSKILFASQCMRRVRNPKTARKYNEACADKWAWDGCPAAERVRFKGAASIKGWRRVLRRDAKGEGDKEHAIAQGWLEIGGILDDLRKRRSPPWRDLTWQECAEQIISGKRKLWPPERPSRPSRVPIFRNTIAPYLAKYLAKDRPPTP